MAWGAWPLSGSLSLTMALCKTPQKTEEPSQWLGFCWGYFSSYHTAPYPRKYEAFNKAGTPELWQVSYFCALLDLKRIKKSQCSQCLGEFILCFTSLLPHQPWDKEVCSWVGLPNVSPPPILTHPRRKGNLNGQKHNGYSYLPSQKAFCHLLPLCLCLVCFSSGGRNKRDEP